MFLKRRERLLLCALFPQLASSPPRQEGSGYLITTAHSTLVSRPCVRLVFYRTYNLSL